MHGSAERSPPSIVPWHSGRAPPQIRRFAAREDDEKRAHDKVQKITDQYIAEIDKHTKVKEQELLEV